MTDINTANAGLIDTSSRSPGLGGIGTGTYTVLHGLNALGGMPALPINADNQGLTFFTRPCLNLSYNNVIGTRKLAYLATSESDSMGLAIKCMLSPPGFETPSSSGSSGRSTITDDLCAFLPISNLLLSLSAPPDLVADLYESSEGYNKEQVSWVDSKPNNYSAYDLTATFANMEGDPITSLFSAWLEYSMRVAEGSMLPFTINLVENRIDYQTRIYRLLLDRSRTYVQRIYACGAAFPTSNPLGAVMGYTHGVHLTPEADQIQITFRCLGAMYDDPILIVEFNKTVVTFNPAMADNQRASTMTKVTGSTKNGIALKSLLNFKMYPRISPTMELEWWANTQDYNNIVNSVNSMSSITTQDVANSPTGSDAISPWTSSLISTSSQ